MGRSCSSEPKGSSSPEATISSPASPATAATVAGAKATIAPVGRGFAEVWQQQAARGDPLDTEGLFWRLYAGDGSHPSLLGSYLAACVMASTMLGVDARDLTFTPAEIVESDARRIRDAAYRAVTDWR